MTEERRVQLERWVQSMATVDRLLPNHSGSRECTAAVRDELAKYGSEFLLALAKVATGESRLGSEKPCNPIRQRRCGNVFDSGTAFKRWFAG